MPISTASAYDVIVSGASLAGLTAAVTCAEAGLSTLLVERKSSFHPPSPSRTVLIPMLKSCGQSFLHEFISHRVRGIRLISPAGEILELAIPGAALDRAAFDSWMVERIRAAEGEVLMGVPVLGPATRNGRVVGVSVLENGSEREIPGHCVIAADGFGSPVVRSLNLPTTRFPNDVAYCLQWEIENATPDTDYFEFFLGRCFAPGWKAAILPEGNHRVIAGVYARPAVMHRLATHADAGHRGEKRPWKEIEELFQRFLENPLVAGRLLERSAGHSGPRVVRESRGFDPIATIPARLVTHGLMVVGSAGGQSGIPYAMLAGKIAGMVCAQAKGRGDFSSKTLLKYEILWKRKVLKDYRLSRRVLRFLERLSDGDLDRLFVRLRKEGLAEAPDAAMKFGLLGKVALREPRIFLRALGLARQ